ncbi:MAG TPA: alpha-amylase family glycosyl hydrolase, partial [Burkholderiales bacterium]|nr:alpha-amylase family glycosyl hydrolase [Burkholderiales bacterium]
MSESKTEQPWWRGAVVYQIFPDSFADSNGDGRGDAQGLLQRLEYLQWLGVDALWLSPMYPSPMADGGYDISDHKGVHPHFGTLEDMDRLIAEAHRLGLRVLLDYVPNHTSDEHPWFVESRSSRNNAKRDWYIWRDSTNNWRAGINCKEAWTWDEHTRQHYLHLFLPQQPDLDWRNPAVVDAMHDVLRFWIERGIDGFRMDAVHCIGKDMSFADDPRCDEGDPISLFNHQPSTHDVLRGIRRFVDALERDTLLVGEVNIRDTRAVVEYYGDDDEVHMSFNFLPIILPWEAKVFRDCICEIESIYTPAKAWPTWVLSNHDRVRHRTRYGGSMARARAAAVMLLTLRGTPFMFQGEELGLEEAKIHPDDWEDPSGRDG